jgi:hypothetical protein
MGTASLQRGFSPLGGFQTGGMAGIVVDLDTSGLNAMHVAVARLWGQFEWISARAMTNAAKASKQAVAAQILPMIQGGPTPWTKRGLIASFARPGELRSQAGFQYGEGKFTDSAFTPKAIGVAPGRYMRVNSFGGDRRPKSSELQLRRAGVIGRDQFITPNSKWDRVDGRGNVPGAEVKRVLSRVRALSDAGSTQNASQSRRSRRKRADVDYFVGRSDGAGLTRWQLGAQPVMIAQRAGAGPKGGTGKGKGRGRPQTVGYKRGFVRAFNIVDQPNYERKFPIHSVAMREYQRVFPLEWRKGFENEIRRRK